MGYATSEVLHIPEHDKLGFGIQISQGFVQNHQRRFPNQSARQGESELVTAG